ncbi:MAG TPA: metalloregulator ArsR/SmtB family transcription factor [Limnobacter sp.]|uniref:ArsR/SmtB family transcription factor n=1 Tax=Limnobacter sp. TaxID=2003368 RepID=UPI002ED7AEEF
MSELDSLLEQVSGYFSVLSEPTRLKIIRVLCDGEKSVNDIVEGVESTQSNVSRHLNLMYRAGVLSRRKEGTLVMYHVKEPTVVELCRTVCVHVAAKMDSAPVETAHAAAVFRQGGA